MIALIAGAVVALLGLFFWIQKGKREGEGAAMELADTSTVAAVNENYQSITGSLGSGNFTHFVELKGQAHAEHPLTSELAQEKVIYYKAQVIHKYERLEEKRDSNGKINRRWVSRSETVQDNEQWADGWGLKDSTGFIEVDASKAKLHHEKLLSKHEQGNNPPQGLNVNLGGLKLNIGGGTSSNNYRSKGYEYLEYGIRVGTDLYVLGDANDRDGVLRVSKPTDRKQPFIVSTKSEDELVATAGSKAKSAKIGAYVCWGLGAAGVIAGLVMIIMGKG